MPARFRGFLCPATTLLALASIPAQETGGTDAPDARQILWQRRLDDALALAKAHDRPLLIAVNMDGESASDRIVHEQYRDPAFVAASRHCVCLVASVFRHTPRDHDAQGRRIVCPRLGEVTCGEHIDLEPVLFEQYLADGERVAPRHALILQDASKAFDLSLSFDLGDIDRALVQAVGSARVSPAPAGERTWLALAARRDQRGRAALEAALLAATDEASVRAALAGMTTSGDAGTLEALRILGARLPSLSPPLRHEVLTAARALHLQEPLARALRDSMLAGGDPTDLRVDPGSAAALLPAIAELDGQAMPTRSFLLACRALADYGDAGPAAIAQAFGSGASAAIEARVRVLGGAFALAHTLQRAGAVTRGARDPLPRPGLVNDAMPTVEALEQELDQVEKALRTHPDDAPLHARFGKASLDLARRRREAQQNDALLLFQDAERYLARALEHEPTQVGWWIERARAAYFSGRFDDQVTHGRRALAAATETVPGTPITALPDPAGLLDDALAIEALRWIGDGLARQLHTRADSDPALELAGILEGLRALGTVATSPFADATDWTSFGSACGALGLGREELAIVAAGAARLPVVPELRQSLNAALWNLGRIDLAPAYADAIATAAGESADTTWFSGHARILAAEDERRREQPELALATYGSADLLLQRAAELNPAYAATCTHHRARTWLGRGFAHARASRQAQAADCLVRAVALDANLSDARDGLGCDVLDLIDKTLEWRATGPSPVDSRQLLDRLDELAPHTPFYAVAVVDSELREALRADGRNPQRVMKETVDASGNKITMPMGLPTEEGDAYLRRSLAAAFRALPRVESDEDRTVLAQSFTIEAERTLERGEFESASSSLAHAAAILGETMPPDAAGADEVRQFAARLRHRLGEARPRQRPGR